MPSVALRFTPATKTFNCSARNGKTMHPATPGVIKTWPFERISDNSADEEFRIGGFVYFLRRLLDLAKAKGGQGSVIH